MTSHRCPSCGGEWEADYCPECGTTIPAPPRGEGLAVLEPGAARMEGRVDPRFDLPVAGPDSRRANVREMNTAAFVTWYVASIVLAGIMIALGFVFIEERMPEAAIALFVIGGLTALVVPVVLMVIFIHRIWSSIQDGYAPTTPGLAVGLCFVPFFNLYWVFRVFPGFATAYNAFIGRHGLHVRPISQGLYVAYAVFCLLGAVPMVNLITAPIGLIVAGFVLADGCRAVNALVDAPAGQGFDRGGDRPTGYDRPTESNTMLGVFAIILSGECLLWMCIRWLDVRFYDHRVLLVGTNVLFSLVPLAMALFVRNLGLKIVAILVSLIPIVRAVLMIIDVWRW